MDVAPGMRVEEARAKLDKLADPKTPPVQEGGVEPEGKDDKDDDDDATEEKKARELGGASKKGRERDEDEGGGTKILWKLSAGQPYEWVFIEADKDGKIAAVFGYCWPEKPISFDKIGDVSKAPFHRPDQVAWDSLQPPLHYRIAATGADEHAVEVSVSLVSLPTNGVRRAVRQ